MRSSFLTEPCVDGFIKQRVILMFRLPVSLGLFCCVLLWTQVGVCQSLQMSDLPGWDRLLDAQEKMQGIRMPRPSDLNWDTDNEVLYFSLRGKGRQKLDLTSGEMSDVKDGEEASERANGRSNRQAGRARQRVARARQRVWINSVDGKWKASYRDFNIHLEPLDGEAEKGDSIQVTKGGSEKHRYGTACWVYGEELDQNDAMWFSPDSRKLAFYEIDESHMKTYFLTTGNTNTYTQLHKEQYPTAGQDNPHVKLHIYDIETQETVTVNVEGPVDQYIYDIQFSSDSSQLIFHRTNRWQNKMELMVADVEKGKTRVVVSEQQQTWQNNSPYMRFLEDGQRFVWETERTGWKQYELRGLDGEKICDLTPEAEYPVHQVLKIDEEGGWFYYSAYSADNPLNLQLHRSRLDGTDNKRLTGGDAHYSAFQFSPDDNYFLASSETIDTPPSMAVWNMQGKKVSVLCSVDTTKIEEAGFVPGELFSFTADDGETEIYGTLYKPRDFDPNKKYPLFIDVYGGPGSVGVTNRYRMANQNCEMGFVIAKIGNRGTVNRGKAFESANYLRLGLVDLDDQAAGVRYLTQRDYIDGDRVGISGHSYGGYMTALALLRYPDLFHVGVAGAPVTDWRNYDTIYTERYMRTPQENKDGYDAGSCLKHVDKLQGKLFVLHGLVDDNVHPSNTWQLINALQGANQRFDMMVFPNSAHGFRYNELKWEYLIRHLQPEVAQSNTSKN